jgi:hypothetical protein
LVTKEKRKRKETNKKKLQQAIESVTPWNFQFQDVNRKNN